MVTELLHQVHERLGAARVAEGAGRFRQTVPMIRNVVLGRLREAPDEEAAARDRARLEEGLAGIAGLELPGRVDSRIGLDAGLREGGWSFAITNDWMDADAYRAYDADEEHLRYRAMLAEVCADVARVQFEAG
jgi:hypothetical protein